jgi:steroid delta-isomerase-like uncharacterized protein
MSFEDNKAIVARFWEIWNRGDWAALDTCLRADYMHHPGANSLSLAQFKQGSAHTRQALPDFQFTLADVVAAEDKVVVRVTGRGTHRGSYLGETPTGKSITACGVVIHRLSGSMIVEDWEFFDVVSLLQQLGVLPQNLGAHRNDKADTD